jgi:6-phosphogluconolactonase
MSGPGSDPRIAWHAFDGAGAWTAACVDALRSALAADLGAHERVLLLVSGGTTPAPVYRAFAQADLDWARVVVSLVDDRDVDAGADGSNARLLRETLLAGRASTATFWPLREAGRSLDDAVRAANMRWPADPDALPLAAAALGMGDDGHTASLFPGATDLDAALASRQPYAAIDASGCAVALPWPRRISLTPAGLARARRRLLLIRGAHKRAVFERALAPGAVRELPIRAAFATAGAPLQVYWCP